LYCLTTDIMSEVSINLPYLGLSSLISTLLLVGSCARPQGMSVDRCEELQRRGGGEGVSALTNCN
jgi:hypothetical protein